MGKIYTRFRGKSWYYSFDASFATGGRRKRIEKGGFKTEKEALREGTTALTSLLHGNIALVSEKISVKEYLESWLEIKKGEVRPKTYSNYAYYASSILPMLGEKPLQSTRPRDVDAAMMELRKKGLSHGSLSAILFMLKNAFNYAVYPGELIQANPAQHIKVPRNAPRNIVERRVIRQDKLRELVEAFPFGDPMHMPIMIAYHTGMRLGEVLGLCWDCADLDRKSISVNCQSVYTPETGYVFAPPKTSASVREIPIDTPLVSLLRRWKAQQSANEMERGKAYYYVYEAEGGRIFHLQKQTPPPEGMERRFPVCTDKDGRLAHGSIVKRQMKEHGVNFHSFRHTHATICAENGAPPKGLAGQFGHKTTNLKENLYTHETQRIQQETMAVFECALSSQAQK